MTFDSGTRIACDLLKRKYLSVTRRTNSLFLELRKFSCDFSGKKRTERGVGFQWQFYFIEIDCISAGVIFIDKGPHENRKLQIG